MGWTKHFGGFDFPEYAQRVRTDGKDIVILARYAGSQLDFGGGPLPAPTASTGATALATLSDTGAYVRSEAILDGVGSRSLIIVKSAPWVVGEMVRPFSGSDSWFSQRAR